MPSWSLKGYNILSPGFLHPNKYAAQAGQFEKFIEFLVLGQGYIEQKEVDPAVLVTGFMDFPDIGLKVK